MPWVNLPGVGTVHIKMAKPRTRKCVRCGHAGTILCDFPIGAKKTCDAALCGSCAVSGGEDVDYCPHHARVKQQQRELFPAAVVK